VKVLQDVLERAKNRPVYSVEKDDVTVPDMIQYMSEILSQRSKGARLSARDLFESQRSRRAAICLFLAILELVKRQVISLQQGEMFGDIDIAKERAVEEGFTEEDNAGRIEQDYK
jgi:segregation and condensation protein A